VKAKDSWPFTTDAVEPHPVDAFTGTAAAAGEAPNTQTKFRRAVQSTAKVKKHFLIDTVAI
jgi:hypothetical protein